MAVPRGQIFSRDFLGQVRSNTSFPNAVSQLRHCSKEMSHNAQHKELPNVDWLTGIFTDLRDDSDEDSISKAKDFIKENEAKKTTSKTESDVRKSNEFLHAKSVHEPILDIPLESLNDHLCDFIRELRPVISKSGSF